MNAFVDPRADPEPCSERSPAQTTAELESLDELHRLCREGRLYDVERWIRTGGPLQLEEGTDVGRRRVTSALEIALDQGNHALALLLLCNWYDPDLEPDCPLDLALRARRWDLVDLLLEWGTDPQRVDLEDLFGTYQTKLFKRFRTLGVDLTAGHVMAEALAYHTSNKPLFGFARRHRKHDPKIQTEANIALAHHAGEGNEKGVALCLWAGADPHVPVPSLGDLRRYGETDDDEDDDEEQEPFRGHTAIEEACRNGDVGILERLGPDPERDDCDALYRAAESGRVVEFLARFALPSDGDEVIRSHLWGATFVLRFRGWQWLETTWQSLDTLRCLFELGVRWEECSREDLAGVRRWLLGTPDANLVDVMKLLATKEYCSPGILHELARTPAMQRRMKEVGFIPPSSGEPHRRTRSRRTRSREVVKKFGVEIPKPPPPPLPRTVKIGQRRPEAPEIRIDRRALFERVWSEPVSKLAEKWGISGPGLAKACRRLQVPVPPRGYWAKLEAGQRVGRPPLPTLPSGQAEEIVLWEPE